MSKRPFKQGMQAAALVVLAACVDGESPTGVGVPRAVSLGALPSFSVVPTQAELNALDSARVRLVNVPNDSLVADTVFAVDPSVAEWIFPLTIQLTPDQVLSLSLSVELIDFIGGLESVEFSGRTEDSFEVQAAFEPKEIREINLHRGPLVNLDLTLLQVQGAPDSLQEGSTRTLQLAQLGDRPGQVIYFRSEDPGIAAIDSAGRLKALAPGNTQIHVFAGRVSDTFDLNVGQVNLPSSQVLQATVMPQLDYVADAPFMATLADGNGALAMKDALDALSLEFLAGRGFDAVGKFDELAAVWEEYGEDNNVRYLDGPQLGVITLALIRAADVLGIKDFE